MDLILIVIVSQSTLFYALLGPSQYSSPLRASIILSHHVPPCCDQLWKRWKSVGFVNIPQVGVKRPWLGSGAGSGENVSYLSFEFCHLMSFLIVSPEAFQPQQHSVQYWMRTGRHLASKKSLPPRNSNSSPFR